MTSHRRLALAALATLPLALAACDNKCPTTNPKVQTGGVPACTGGSAIQAGAQTTIRIGVCPRCDESYDQCNVTMPAGDNIIQLDPLVQVCEPSNSCGTEACNLVTCTFTAPATPGTYRLFVNSSNVGLIEQSLEVVGSGGGAVCPSPT